MRTDELAQRASDSVRSMDELAYESISMICRSLWQISTKRVQRLYPQFALPMQEHVFERISFRWGVGEQFLTLKETFFLIEDLAPILHLLDEKGWVSDRLHAGRLLQRASFARCLLGHEASLGDVQQCVQFFAAEKSPANSSPQIEWERYLRGDALGLKLFFNNLLAESVEGLAELTGDPDIFPGVFWYELEKDRVYVHSEVVGTHYYLISALLRFLEPYGTA